MVIDPLVKLRGGVDIASGSDLHLSTLSRELKTLAMEQNVGIFVTTGVQGAAGSSRPSMMDMEKQASLLYDAQAVLLIYCDYFTNRNYNSNSINSEQAEHQ